MTPERWRQIEDLYNAARERGRGVLAETDPDLRREVERMLDQPSGSSPLDSPAWEGLETVTGTQASIGSSLGPYRIEERIGAGGMGEVFRATDTRLRRTVAIKILQPGKALDADRKLRFLREARAASALTHPNIITLHDIASDSGVDYLVMEYAPGKSLDKLIRSGGLPYATVVAYATQLAGALAAAHAAGIVHRDIKPGNIMVTGQPEQVKVLDFGLAKLEETAAGPDDDTRTTEPKLTESGMVMGTMAYMSPEQARGEAVDGRTDLFSFGAVLYEMATGRRAFQKRLDWTMPASEGLPAELRPIVQKLLAPEKDRRYQQATEVLADLRVLWDRLQPRTRSWKLTAATAAAVVASIAAGYFYLHRAPTLTDKDSLVLGEFVNQTGDPVFDDTLRQGMAAQLEQSPFLSLVSDQRIQGVLGLMAQPGDARLTWDVARQVCQRTSSAAVLDGSIKLVGSSFLLDVRARACLTGDDLFHRQATSSKKEDVLKQLSDLASQFRRSAGESLATVKKYDMPLDEATTPSLEALKAYSLGMKLAYSQGFAKGLPHINRAVEIDPHFGRAFAELGMFYGESGEFARSRQSFEEAYRLRDRVGESEKAFIEANYAAAVTGDLLKAQTICEAWAQAYPRKKEPHGMLSAMVYQELGKFEQSIEQGRIATGIDPGFAPGYINRIWSYLYLDRVDEAAESLRQGISRKLEPEDFYALRYYIAWMKGDQPGMNHAVEVAKGQRDVEDWILDEQSFAAAFAGRLKGARAMSTRAQEMAGQADHKEKVAMYQAGAAVREALFGNDSEALRNANAALKLTNDQNVEFGAAFALALAGDARRCTTIADGLERRFPQDTIVRFNYVPTLRALVALRNGNPQKAMELPQTYDLVVTGTWFGFFGFIYPAYVRGEGYLAAHKGFEAAVEFRKIIDHRGLVFVDPVGPVARARLGKALAMAGDQAGAKAAYDGFFDLWKAADRDLPILVQAKTDSAALR